MKPVLIFVALLLSVSYARAEILFFDASQAAGTEKMADVRKVEFLFDRGDRSLRLCGAWIFADGRRTKFEQTWELAGSSVLGNGKSIGSYHDGNFLIEENIGGSKHQAIEVTRENETFFEYHYHHPDLGFVDGDGWLVENPSNELRRSCVSSSVNGRTESEISARLAQEYANLRALALAAVPDSVVGGYLNSKSYGDHQLLWKLAEEPGDNEVVRIYRPKGQGLPAMDITFHFSHQIVKGRTVIRRFVGPSTTGWRNDTVDVETGEYLGSQGASKPTLDRRDQEILTAWGIELF